MRAAISIQESGLAVAAITPLNLEEPAVLVVVVNMIVYPWVTSPLIQVTWIWNVVTQCVSINTARTPSETQVAWLWTSLIIITESVIVMSVLPLVTI